MDFDYVERDLKAVQNAEWDLNEFQSRYTELLVASLSKLGKYFMALTNDNEIGFGEFIDWPYVERSFTNIKCYPATIVGCKLNQEGLPEQLICYHDDFPNVRDYVDYRCFPGVLDMIYNRMIVEVIDRLQEKTYINDPSETLKYDNKWDGKYYGLQN